MRIFSKMATFCRRVASGSFQRFFRNLELAHQESGRSKVILFGDMLTCLLFKGVGYSDYMNFGFAVIDKEKRKTYLTMDDNIAMVHRLNDRQYYPVFDDKLIFNKTFSRYLKRDYADLHDGWEAFDAFCQGKENFFAKLPVSFGGLGVKKIDLTPQTDTRALYNELYEQGYFLAEETIRQHETMNLLCARSVNTIRIVTILSDSGKVHVMYATLRVGTGEKDVDNATSGGLYAMLNSEGVITHRLFCNKTDLYYDTHPVTGFPFMGFAVPMFDEALAMCREAALVEPHMRYVGWDVAITPDGPVFVEGNNLPGYDLCQNHHFHDDDCGMKPAFEKAIAD